MVNHTHECKHDWSVLEASRAISEYTGLETGIKRCKLCSVAVHFTRDPNPSRYPMALSSAYRPSRT